MNKYDYLNILKKNLKNSIKKLKILNNFILQQFYNKNSSKYIVKM